MLIQSNFKSAWWLNNPHLQTLYPALLRKLSPHPLIKRERLTTPDGDFLDIDWCGDKAEQPLIILLHGLTGCSKSGYIKGLQYALLAQNFRSVVLNFRGCSGESNHLARCYHSGDTEDIHFLYNTLRQREKNTQIAVIGFSIGGNVVLKWLGEQKNNVDIFAAIAVSVPLVLSTCATQLDNGFAKIYRASLLKELKDYISDKIIRLEQLDKFDEAKKLHQLGDLSAINSFWQYDDRVVAKLHNFKNVSEYYQRSSSRQFIQHITRTTLIIQALDDPFMNPSVIPTVNELSSKVQLEITQGGGHVGFISGNNPLKPRYWLEQRIPEFLRQQL